MYCQKYGKQCQMTGCNNNWKFCELYRVELPPSNVDHLQSRIKQLEQENANLRAENMNLRNRINATQSYKPY